MAGTPIDKLDKAIKDILDSYGDEVKTDVAVVTKAVTQEGVKAIKAESKQKFGTTKKRTKKYANTWSYSFEQGRARSTGTIYNTQPGLPHLLENGHVVKNGYAKRGGGRSDAKDYVEGREHIKPVEDKIAEAYEKQLVKVLTT